MRLTRVLAVAFGFAAAVSAPGGAQDARQFKDSWFWGVKGGGILYTSQSSNTGAAPLVGAEWLITRTNGGLYLSLDQAFFTTTGGFIDRDPDSVSTFVRGVDLKNMRRFSAVGMIFPAQSNRVHPYFGGGLSFNQIAGAALASPVANPARFSVAQDSIISRKAGFSPMFIGGAQMRFRPVSGFAQVTLSPVQQSFFLSQPGGARPFNFSLEFGARYNVGTSIDKGR